MLTSLLKPEDSLLNAVRLTLFAMIFFYLITILNYSYMPLPLILDIDMNNIPLLKYAGATEKQEVKDVRENSSLSLTNLIQQGSPYLGDPSAAPITIIDFSDFQCYLCARYVKATEPLIRDTYIETGKVVLVFKHLPNRGFDSLGASIAAQCAHEQGKFWEFHNILYENQKPIDSGWVNQENLKKFAARLDGLDIEKFNECLDNQKYKEFVKKDIDLGSPFGFQDTPSFVIVNSKDGSNPEVLKGAHPFPSFKALIDKRLSEVQNNN
jgi:protein-disulfide isomerase